MSAGRLRFVPYHELAATPNIVVDGAASEATLLTLSHWPKSGTPWPLKDDLSAQIVFRYLDRPDLRVPAEAVSNNHFDEDGLIGLFTILNPEEARPCRDLLVDVAAAGDFGTYRRRQAARITFVLSAFADSDLSPLDAGLFRSPYPRLAAGLYQELLPRLPEIVSKLDSFRNLWQEEDALLEASERSIRSREIEIREIPELDLAVVTLPERLSGRRVHRFTQDRLAACHPMAVHNATRRFRILLMQGRSYDLQYRYETWVQHVSRRPMPRVDLDPLASRLSQKENGNGRWTFDGVDEITPRLRLDGAEESRIPPEEFLREIERFLETAPPTWDPFDAGGPPDPADSVSPARSSG